MILANKLHCIICSEEVSGKKPVNSMVAEILLELFKNFAKCMNWSIGKNVFDFNHEPFPFCQKCKLILVELSKLSEDMDRILTRIKEISTNAAAKIVLSNLKEQKLIIDDEYLGEHKIKGLSRLPQKLEYFRNQTVDEYSPYIALINNKAESTWKKRKRQKNQVKDKPVGLKHSKKRIIAVSIEQDDEMDSTPVDNFKLRKKLPQESYKMDENSCWDGKSQELNRISYNLVQSGHSKNKNKNKKEWFRCSECNEGCRSKSALEMHQLMTCGKYSKKNPLIKINKNTFSFDGIPLFKDKNRYSCGICGNTFTNKLYTQFHVRKSHTDHLSLTTESRNDEDLETDIKPLPLEVVLRTDF